MGRPSKPDTRYFQRTLSDPQRMVMLAAGKGNICRGFENMIDLYSEAHNKGYRPGMELSILNIDRERTDNPNDEESIRDSMRESIGNR